MKPHEAIVPLENIERLILLIRGQRVILDADLAILYGLATKRLNEQVKRNRERFPGRFLFQLTSEEKAEVVANWAEVVANCDHLRKRRFSPILPNAFTEYGAIMAATVLNSPRAVQVGIYVVEAFVRLREVLALNRGLAQKFEELERKIATHDEQIQAIFETIRQLMTPPETRRRKLVSISRKAPCLAASGESPSANDAMKRSSACHSCVRLSVAVVCSACLTCIAAPAPGPLRVHPTNSRYFTDGTKCSDGSLKADLSIPRITAYQEAYVRKVIDTVNDPDNVLYEIGNDGDLTSVRWQYHFIRLIRHYEAGKTRQHPVGMTAVFNILDGTRAPDDRALFESPADWISPGLLWAG